MSVCPFILDGLVAGCWRVGDQSKSIESSFKQMKNVNKYQKLGWNYDAWPVERLSSKVFCASQENGLAKLIFTHKCKK